MVGSGADLGPVCWLYDQAPPRDLCAHWVELIEEWRAASAVCPEETGQRERKREREISTNKMSRDRVEKCSLYRKE